MATIFKLSYLLKTKKETQLEATPLGITAKFKYWKSISMLNHINSSFKQQPQFAAIITVTKNAASVTL